jgi:hypothetical protein
VRGIAGAGVTAVRQALDQAGRIEHATPCLAWNLLFEERGLPAPGSDAGRGKP